MRPICGTSRRERAMTGRAVFGLGPLERWLGDDDVSEVLVNGGRHVWVERRSAQRGTEYVGTLDDGVIDTIIERILTPVGRRLDRMHPVVDARLPDGARVCAVLPPVAVDGTCLSVRKFARAGVPLERFGGPHLVSLLTGLVGSRCNVLVSGSTSSGKTTLLNALASHIPIDERIVTLEDTAELHLDTPHVLRLETRPESAEGVPGVPMSHLLRTALRLRPDRLVVGEVRGGEAVELVQALNTGHDGSLCTIHANSATEALGRLESLVVQGTPSWPMAAVREQVRASIDVVVHVERTHDGTRRIGAVSEVLTHGERMVRTLADRVGVRNEPTRGRR